MKIHTAAANGHKDAVLRELEMCVAVDALDDKGRTPLMVAVSSSRSNLGTVQLLLDKGANPNSVGGEPATSVLIEAVIVEDLDYIGRLLDAGADINLMTEDYGDALSVAVRGFRSPDGSWLSIMNLLIDRGAVVQEDEDGESALSAAFDDGNFVALKRLVEAGADETRLTWTPLTRALVIGTVDEVKVLVEQGASLKDRDCWKRTPWLVSLAVGDVEKAKVLMNAGANINDVGHCGKTPLMYAIEASHLEMLKWLLEIGLDVQATNEFGETALLEVARWGSVACVQMLLEGGANPNKVSRTYRNTIEFTTSREVARLLIEAGQDINRASTHLRALLFGIDYEDTVVVSREECDAGAQPRFGTSNPEKMDVPLWNAMAQTGESSEARRTLFAAYDSNLFWESCVGTYPFEKYPLWFYPRYGMSLTALPDGRFVEIGGYFEEGGNPNFCIYNEVFVRYPDQKLDIYGYPLDVFPPTDGHSATLVDEYIYIIGCIGYPDERIFGYTPVYRLNTHTFSIEKVETSGDNPGWIFNHRAVLVDDEIHIQGGEVWLEPENDKMERIYALLAKENISSPQEWNEALHRHYPNSKSERFALNLKSFEWRRLDKN